MTTLPYRNYTSITNLMKSANLDSLKEIDTSLYQCQSFWSQNNMYLSEYTADLSDSDITFINKCCRDIPNISYIINHKPLLTELCGIKLSMRESKESLGMLKIQMMYVFQALARKGVSSINIAYISKVEYISKYSIIIGNDLIEIDTNLYYILTISSLTKSLDQEYCMKSMQQLWTTFFPQEMVPIKMRTTLCPFANKVLGRIFSVPEIDLNIFFDISNRDVYKKYTCLNDTYDDSESNMLVNKFRLNLPDNIPLNPVQELNTTHHFAIISKNKSLNFNFLKNALSQQNLRELEIDSKVNFVSFIWTRGVNTINCDVVNKLDGDNIITNSSNLHRNLSFYFPDLTNKSFTLQKSFVYMLVNVINGVLYTYIIDSVVDDVYGTHYTHNKMSIESATFQNSVRKIVYALSQLLEKTISIKEGSKNGFQIYTIKVDRSDVSSLVDVSNDINHIEILHSQEFSMSVFSLINESIIKPIYTKTPIPRGFYEHKLNHVLLEPLSYKHVIDLEKIASDVETMKHIGTGGLWTREIIKNKIDANLLDTDLKQYFHYALIHPITFKVIGYAGLHPMLYDREGLQLRVFVDKSVRGNGFGGQAITQLINMNIPYTIYGVTEAENTSSIKMMEKVGLSIIEKMVIRGRDYLVLQANFYTHLGNFGTNYSLAKTELPKLVRDKTIEYPYLKLYTPESKIIDYFNQLKNIGYGSVSDDYTLYNINISQPIATLDGKFIQPDNILSIQSWDKKPYGHRSTSRLVSRKTEVNNIGSITDYFSEPIRVHCKFLRNQPIINYYQTHIPEIVDELMRDKLPVNLMQLRELLWRSKNKQCTTFKPKILRYCVYHFKAKRVLDISAGWGDRLVGSMASNVDLYHAFDPNINLQPAYNEIIRVLKPYAVNRNIECIIKPIPFEEAVLNNNYYDLVMSSPPYFMMEIYSDMKTQSTYSTRNEKEWYDRFLKVWIDKCYKALKVGGILCLNINQERGNKYVNWLFSDLSETLVDTKKGFAFIGTLGYVNDTGNNTQPIFVWQKI